MKSLAKILFMLVVLFGGLAIVINQQPDEFRVTRATVIHAAPADILPKLDNLHAWQEWSPWAKMDPDAMTSFSGPDSGVGAAMSWEGHESGKGTMTVTDSTDDHVVYKLDFIKPLPATNTAEITLTPQGDETVVTWSMYGKNSFLGKTINIIMNCDEMIGSQFQDGLDSLRVLVEKKD